MPLSLTQSQGEGLGGWTLCSLGGAEGMRGGMWDRGRDLVGERTLHVQLCASSGKMLDVEERDRDGSPERGVHLLRATQHHSLNTAPPDSTLGLRVMVVLV